MLAFEKMSPFERRKLILETVMDENLIEGMVEAAEVCHQELKRLGSEPAASQKLFTCDDRDASKGIHWN